MNLSVGECAPKPFRQYPLVSKKLRDGYSLHGFRSGGGLRVLYFHDKHVDRRPEGDVGYGEHPYVEQALDYVESDLAVGGREYESFYGVEVPHFLTGCSTPSSEVDRWILSGRPFDVMWLDGKYIFFSEWRKSAVPRDVRDQVERDRESRLYIDSRGYEFHVSCTSPFGWAKGVTVRIVNPTWDEHDKHCREAGIAFYDPYEIKTSFEIEDETLEALLAKMNRELPNYWDK